MHRYAVPLTLVIHKMHRKSPTGFVFPQGDRVYLLYINDGKHDPYVDTPHPFDRPANVMLLPVFIFDVPLIALMTEMGRLTSVLLSVLLSR